MYLQKMYEEEWDAAKYTKLEFVLVPFLGGASASALAPFMGFPESVAMPNQSFERERERESES